MPENAERPAATGRSQEGRDTGDESTPAGQRRIALERFLKELRRFGVVTAEGSSWRAHCPVHGGHSLTVSRGKKHPIVTKCMGGECDVKQIVQALGLNMGDLFAPNGQPKPSAEKTTQAGISVSSKNVGQWHRDLNKRFPKKLRRLTSQKGLTLATIREAKIGWDGQRYTIPVFDADGSLINVRSYSFVSTVKMKGLRDAPTSLFLMGETIRERGEVILCEGEFDALLAGQEGLPAVTTTGGATTWRPEWTQAFADLDVYIVMDCDDAGRKGALKRAEALHGTARSVRIVDLDPKRRNGYDLGDFLQGDGTARDVRQLMLRAPVYPETEPRDRRLVDGATFVFSEPTDIPALWGAGAQVLWAEGEGLLIVGPQGVGKTTLAQQIVVARLGIADPELLGFPVVVDERRILYLAMNRRTFGRVTLPMPRSPNSGSKYESSTKR